MWPQVEGEAPLLPAAPQTFAGINCDISSSSHSFYGGKEQHHDYAHAQQSFGTCGSSTNLCQPSVPPLPVSVLWTRATAEPQQAYQTPPRPCRQAVHVPQSPLCASNLLDQLLSVSGEAGTLCLAAQPKACKSNHMTAAHALPELCIE